MNPKHKKTLAAIFAKQVPKAMLFRDIESLLKSLGCEVREGDGSRVLFTCRGISWAVHRPHPQKEVKAYRIKEAREFLRALEVKP